MPLNTTVEIYRYLSLTKEDIPQSMVEDALVRGNAVVIAFAHDDGSERSARIQGVRKMSELLFTCAEVMDSYANSQFLSQPPIRILNVLNLGAGADNPTPTEILSALKARAEDYRSQGFAWLKRLHPITATMKTPS